MLKIIIGDKEFNTPMKQSEINWKLGKRIQDVVDEMGKDSPEAKKWILATLMGVDYNVVDQVADDQVALVVDNHKFFNEEVKIWHMNYIRLKGKTLKFIRFDKLTVRQAIELDLGAVDNNDEDFFLSLYRKTKWWDFRKHVVKLIIKNRKSFDELNFFRIKVAEYIYLEFKRKMMRQYGLLGVELPPDQIDATPPALTGLEKLGLYAVILQYSDGDPRLLDFWMDRPITELFKYLYAMKLIVIDRNKES